MNTNEFLDTLIISYCRQEDKNNSVLIVGRKAPKKDADIVNAFQGKEADELYERLITVMNKEEKKEN